MNLKAKTEAVLKRSVERGDIAGAGVLVRLHGKEILYASAGYADIASGAPIRRDNIFRLYSQSKPITSAAALLLCERGQLDLMSEVQNYLPGFKGQKALGPNGPEPVRRAARVMDLLGMTAGLCYPDVDEAGQSAARVFEENQRLMDAGKGMSTLEFANRLGECVLAFHPGDHFRYSTCADILGAVVEAVDGRPYSQFLREEFFEPLGMKDTAFWVPQEKQDRFVTPYQRTESGLIPWRGVHLCCGRYDVPPAFESGGAGLVSTLDDYAAFAQMLLNGGEYNGRCILSPETVRFMTSPQHGAAPARDMWDTLEGFTYAKLLRICTEPGRVNGLARKDEYGWDGWLGTYFANFPNEEMTLLFATNLTDSGTTPTARCVRNAVLSEMAAEGLI